MMLHSNRTDVSLVHQVNKAALNLNRKPKLILPKSGKEDVLLLLLLSSGWGVRVSLLLFFVFLHKAFFQFFNHSNNTDY